MIVIIIVMVINIISVTIISINTMIVMLIIIEFGQRVLAMIMTCWNILKRHTSYYAIFN